MNDKLLKLASYFLEKEAEWVSNRSCNDIDPDLFKDWTAAEKMELIIDLWKYNNSDLFDEEECWHKKPSDFADWFLMYYLADKLKEIE